VARTQRPAAENPLEAWAQPEAAVGTVPEAAWLAVAVAPTERLAALLPAELPVAEVVPTELRALRELLVLDPKAPEEASSRSR
jgi:hypothetical protein